VAHALKRGPSPVESGLSLGKTEMHLWAWSWTKSRLYRFVPVTERPKWKAFAFNQSGTAQILASLSFLFWGW